MIQQLEGSDTAKLLLGYVVKSSKQLNQLMVEGTIVISKYLSMKGRMYQTMMRASFVPGWEMGEEKI